jgi:hypothetical protein
VKFLVALLFVVLTASAQAQTPVDTTLPSSRPVPDSVQPAPVQAPTLEPEEPAPPPVKKSNTKFSVTPSLGVTVESLSGDDETFTANWLAGLQSRLFVDGSYLQLGGSVYIKYGQLHSEEVPKKTQDDLIVSVTPSIPLIPGAGIRLFLETTGETQMAPGLVDDTVETNFLDPLFLYQSLFVGKRLSTSADDGSWNFDFTAGVGYALQQTFAQKFVLEQNRNFVITEESPLSSVQDQVTVESGYSAILDINFDEELASNLTFKTNFKTVALTKDEFIDDVANARATSLLLIGFQYKFVSLDYSGHLVYDRNISPRRSLEQSLVFGFKVTL